MEILTPIALPASQPIINTTTTTINLCQPKKTDKKTEKRQGGYDMNTTQKLVGIIGRQPKKLWDEVNLGQF